MEDGEHRLPPSGVLGQPSQGMFCVGGKGNAQISAVALRGVGDTVSRGHLKDKDQVGNVGIFLALLVVKEVAHADGACVKVGRFAARR